MLRDVMRTIAPRRPAGIDNEVARATRRQRGSMFFHGGLDAESAWNRQSEPKVGCFSSRGVFNRRSNESTSSGVGEQEQAAT
jgi:hypothetical protein